MMRPRFLADEDLRGNIVRTAKRREPQLDISTVVEHGLSSASDDDVLDFA
jgi:hypothetical protein